ncbi:MAG: hypothetical protein J7L26_07495 [Candidatus Aminicenantes bacterium]|nr:hypothetical protein [Candidatus Aminicenantes bacterium]
MREKFIISGFHPKKLTDGTIPVGQLKSQARRVSHQVAGCDDKVGPVIRFERYGRIYERPLTRRELVFGVRAPEDGKGGGFAGLVIWRDLEEDRCEVIINLARARAVGAEEWIEEFVKKIILAAGWKIIE